MLPGLQVSALGELVKMVSQLEEQNLGFEIDVSGKDVIGASFPYIKVATAAHESPTVDVILMAFSADPIARWTWSDLQHYVAYFPSFIEAVGGKAFTNGSAYYAEGYAGAALWLPPNIQPDDNELVDLLKNTVSKPFQEDVTAFPCLVRYITLPEHKVFRSLFAPH